MIAIHYTCDGGSHQLHISGHAGYAPHGQDIVCAGVSALSFALLETLRQRGAAVEEAAWHSGALDLRCRQGQEADSLFQMALTGFRSIARTYPQYAEVNRTP